MGVSAVTMMLIILDKNPEVAASLVPDKIKFKQLIELCQLVCSTGICDIFKAVHQGHELQNWIGRNMLWTYRYMTYLLYWAMANTRIKPATSLRIYKIRNAFYDAIERKKRIRYPKTAVLRYRKGYECKYPTKTELPIDECISEYKKYCIWKGWK